MVDFVQILNSCKTIAVVGLSPKPDRASYVVAQYMQVHGYRIIPINPNAAASNSAILGEKAYASLEDAAKCEQIQMVNCFRNSVDIPPIADSAIAAGFKSGLHHFSVGKGSRWWHILCSPSTPTDTLESCLAFIP